MHTVLWLELQPVPGTGLREQKRWQREVVLRGLENHLLPLAYWEDTTVWQFLLWIGE